MEAKSISPDAEQFVRSVSVIVLAAGLSSRMGKQNKLLLEVEGQPLIARTIKTLKQHPFTEITVVLGHEAERVLDAVSDLNVNFVVNRDFEQGQMTSVYTGLSSLQQPVDGVMIFLSDLALITASDLTELRLAFDQCEQGVLVPTYHGQRGNPIILHQHQRDAILSGNKNLGCKKLIEKHPELVTPVPMYNDHFVFDVDTPEAYQQLLKRLDATQTKRTNINQTLTSQEVV